MNDEERKLYKLNKVTAMLGSNTVSRLREPLEVIAQRVTEDQLDKYLFILGRLKAKKPHFVATQ